MLEEFNKYVNTFYNNNEDNDKGIKLRYDHSIRVMNLMNSLALSLKYDKETSIVTGLLHDYGRFHQWKK